MTDSSRSFVPPPRIEEIRASVTAGRFEEAETLLQELMVAEPGNAKYHSAASTLHHMHGRVDDAIVEIRQGIQLNPKSLIFRKNLITLLVEAKRQPEAEREAATTVDMASSVLGTDLPELLTAVHHHIKDSGAHHPFLNWVWEVAGRPDSERNAWDYRARWGHAIDCLLVHWITFNRNHLDSLDGLSEAPNWSPVRSFLNRGRGVLLASNHFGPKLVALDGLIRGGPHAKWFSHNQAYGITSRSNGFISTLADPNRTIFAMCRHLQDGGLIYIACDGDKTAQFRTVDILGRQFRLPLGPATLAYHGGAAIFWYAACWEGNRIQFELEEGPCPASNESFDIWCERWFAFVSARLAVQLKGSPENFRVDQGISTEFHL